MSFRVALFGRWNATCGVSMHAELIGREFIEMGNELLVFAPTLGSANKWWHHIPVREDEDFVIRCYEEASPGGEGGRIRGDGVLSEDYDIFIVESYASIPYRAIHRVLPRINKKARTILVVHEGSREEFKYPNPDAFDAIVVFDERYVREIYSSPKVRIIPYPCHPVSPRKSLPGEKLRFFTFGRQPPGELADYIRALGELRKKYDLVYNVVRADSLLEVREPWIMQRVGCLSTDEVYEYLRLSDLHLLPKGDTRRVVVSSTFCQTAGSLCPIVAPQTRHFETLPEKEGVRPVVLYRGLEDLKHKIEALIEDEEYRRRVVEMAVEYVNRNSSEVVAREFLELFES
jgi:glycosyltransferase involved in cell wall biosynthesis